MQATTAASRTVGQPGGVIDTLTAGYLAINKHVWILLLPIVVDLFLWLGPQVSLSPVLHPVVIRATEIARQAGAAAPSPPTGFAGRRTPDSEPQAAMAAEAPSLEALSQDLMNRIDSTNVLGLLSHSPLALPSVAAFLGGSDAFSFVQGWADALPLLAAALGGGFLVGGFYRGAIARVVIGANASTAARDALRRLPIDAARVLGLLATLLGVLLLMGVPLLLVVAAATMVVPAIGVLGSLLIGAAVLFAEVHLFFAIDAIFVSGVGPLAAIQRSVGIVRRHIGATLALVLLTWLILAGMDRVWELAASQLQAPFGQVLSILGNAYIASGLIAASMIFYRDRLPALGEGTSANARAGDNWAG